MVIAVIVLLLGIFIGTGYAVLWYFSNDRRIPAKHLPAYKRIMVIFPHPDDEVLTCGGVLHDFADHDAETHLVILTKGERGVEGAHFTTSLKAVREGELAKSAAALQVSALHLTDLGDGEIQSRLPEAAHLIDNYLTTINPDLVITYDQSGLYGHPDHMGVSTSVTQAVKHRADITLWYATRPARVFKHLRLPIHMAKDPDFIKLRTYPSFRIVISASGILAKIRSMYAHQSQHFAFKKNRPWLPLWFYLLTQTDEYFYQA